MLLLTLLASLTAPALSQETPDCDAKELAKTLSAARGDDVLPAYGALVTCDAELAKAQARTTLNKVRTGEAVGPLAVQAATAGAHVDLYNWRRSRDTATKGLIDAALIEACPDSEAVANWHAHQARVDKAYWAGDTWSQLGSCHQEPVAELLRAQVKLPPKDREAWMQQIDVYSKSAGGDSLELLAALFPSVQSGAEAKGMFAAMWVASKTATEDQRFVAAELLTASSPNLPKGWLPILRKLLLEFKADTQAEQLAALFYADALHSDGQLHYGVVVIETGRCRRKSTQIRAHVGEGIDPGNKWPDQVSAQIKAKVRSDWSFTLAKDCGGGASTDVYMSAEPLTPDALRAWQQEQVDTARATESDAFEEVEETVVLKP